MINKVKLASLDARIAKALSVLHAATDKCAPAPECWALEDALNDLRAKRADLVCQNEIEPNTVPQCERCGQFMEIHDDKICAG